MSAWMLLAVLSLAADAPQSDRIYTCVIDGVRVFQDHACRSDAIGAGQRQLERAEGDADQAQAQRQQQAAKAEAQERSRQLAAWDRRSRQQLPASLGGTEKRAAAPAPARSRAAASTRGAGSGCDGARAARDDAYRQRSNIMGFDERRRLDDQVTRSCGLQ